MNRKRWLEIGSGLLLLLTLVGVTGGYAYWRVHRDRATRELVRAMEAFDTQAMREAVLRGADVRVKTGYRGGPLCVAAVRDDPELLRLLLQHGADPNARDDRGMTPLMWEPSYYTTELLLSCGADVNATDHDGESALACVVWKEDEESLRVARLLLKHGARPRPADLLAARGNPRMTALLNGGAAKR